MNVRDRHLLLWAHRDVTCPDCKWLLFFLVRDYSTREGITRPGWRRLMERTGRGRRWVKLHLDHLEAEGHVVVKRKGDFLPGKGADRATEYLVTWLSDARLTTRSDPSAIAPRSGRSGARSGARSDGHTRAPLLSLRDNDDGGAFERAAAVIGDEDDAAAATASAQGERPPPAAAHEGRRMADEPSDESAGQRSALAVPDSCSHLNVNTWNDGIHVECLDCGLIRLVPRPDADDPAPLPSELAAWRTERARRRQLPPADVGPDAMARAHEVLFGPARDEGEHDDT